MGNSISKVCCCGDDKPAQNDVVSHPNPNSITTNSVNIKLKYNLRTKKETINSCKVLSKGGSLEKFFNYAPESHRIVSSFEDIRNVYMFDPKALGKGHFGSVRKARCKVNPEKLYAVKTMKLKDAPALHKNLFEKELSILRRCDHPNIGKFYESYKDDMFLHIVIDYCAGGDLVQEIMNQGTLPEPYAKKLFFQALCAINALHAQGVAHLDVKPDNFLFVDESKQQVKLTDFGLSEYFDLSDSKNCFTTMVGTPWYVAPEVLDQKFDRRVDYWSAGVTLYLM